jgi:hypothetical protein
MSYCTYHSATVSWKNGPGDPIQLKRWLTPEKLCPISWKITLK